MLWRFLFVFICLTRCYVTALGGIKLKPGYLDLKARFKIGVNRKKNTPEIFAASSTCIDLFVWVVDTRKRIFQRL